MKVCFEEEKGKDGLGLERLQEGLSYTDEWALAGNQRVASLSNESEDATRKKAQYVSLFSLSEREIRL